MKVYTCTQWNPETGTCEAQGWADPMPLGLPPLTPSEGAMLGAAVFVMFGIAWCLKWLRRFISSL